MGFKNLKLKFKQLPGGLKGGLIGIVLFFISLIPPLSLILLAVVLIPTLLISLVYPDFFKFIFGEDLFGPILLQFWILGAFFFIVIGVLIGWLIERRNKKE